MAHYRGFLFYCILFYRSCALILNLSSSEHDEPVSELVGTAATKSFSQSTAVVSCRQQETSELVEEKLESRESKAETTEDALDASSKTMSIKER